MHNSGADETIVLGIRNTAFTGKEIDLVPGFHRSVYQLLTPINRLKVKVRSNFRFALKLLSATVMNLMLHFRNPRSTSFIISICSIALCSIQSRAQGTYSYDDPSLQPMPDCCIGWLLLVGNIHINDPGTEHTFAATKEFVSGGTLPTEAANIIHAGQPL